MAEPSRKPREREREKRRGDRATERKTVSPAASSNSYFDGAPASGIDRYYPNNDAYAAGDRDRDRDLSSISNSSNGSASNRRSQESPDHDRELKRRKLDVKVNKEGKYVFLCANIYSGGDNDKIVTPIMKKIRIVDRYFSTSSPSLDFAF